MGRGKKVSLRDPDWRVKEGRGRGREKEKESRGREKEGKRDWNEEAQKWGKKIEIFKRSVGYWGMGERRRLGTSRDQAWGDRKQWVYRYWRNNDPRKANCSGQNRQGRYWLRMRGYWIISRVVSRRVHLLQLRQRHWWKAWKRRDNQTGPN